MIKIADSNQGQSEIIGELLIIALIFFSASILGGFYLTQYGTNNAVPAGDVRYEMNVESVNIGGTTESRFVLTAQASSMERADRLEIYYDETDNKVAELTSVGEEVKIGDTAGLEIKDGDRFYAVAEYKGRERVLNEYIFDQNRFVQSR